MSSNTTTALRTMQPCWDASHMPSQQGKVVIVTGANAGIGFEAAKKLAERHAIVVLACRNDALGLQAQHEILQHVELHRATLPSDERAQLAPPQVEFMRLDLGNFASIEAFSEEFRANFTHVDILINNAGVAAPAIKQTIDGIESQFGINHVGHFLLTKLLFDLLEKAPAARVVTVSSRAHRRAVVAIDPQTGRDCLVGESGYAASKMANLLFTYELERRLRAKRIDHIVAVACHPGWASTAIVGKFLSANVPRVLHWLCHAIVRVVPMVQTAEMGALPTLYAATADDVQGCDFFGPEHWGLFGYPVRELSALGSYNEDAAKALWSRSEELIKSKFVI